MKPWTEDDFLERLMPQLRRETRTRMQSCPDAELLASFAEERVAPFVRNAITEHLSECRECSEICARLLSFDTAPAVGSGDPEWVNAEKRLGNWMDGFLQTKEAQAAPARTMRVKEDPKPASFWKWGWVLGAVAVVALAVGTAVVLQRNRPQVARVPVHAAKQPAVQTPAPNSVQENRPAQAATGNATSSVEAPAPAPDAIAKVTPQQPLAKPNSAVPVQPKAPTPGLKITPKKAPAIKPSIAPSAKPGAPASGDVVAQTSPADSSTQAADNSSQEVHTYSPPNLQPNDRILANGNAPVAPARGASISNAAVDTRPNSASSANSANVTPASKTLLPNANYIQNPKPARLQIDSGVRIWVTMITSAASNHANEGAFHGKLLTPLTKGGKTVLERDTEFLGTRSMQGGKLKVTVEQVVVHGTVYQLRKSSSNQGISAPGSGSAVKFDSGNVMEMWLGATSIYEIGSGK